MIHIKNALQIQNIQVAGNIISQIFLNLGDILKDGMSTFDIDRAIHEMIIKEGGKPAFLGYKGFPASSCISVNEEIIHGIPSKKKIVQDGDLLSIDVGVSYDGNIADSAYTYYLSPSTADSRVQLLLQHTQLALQKGIETIRHHSYVSDVSKAVMQVAETHNLGIVKDYCGHGVGLDLHESPEIPNYYPNGSSNVRLKKGMVVAIEPMFTLGDGAIKLLADNFTVASADNSLAAHFEHTVLVKEDGYKILTA